MDRNVRAGDADRDRAAEALRRHYAEGRLSSEEFDERLSLSLQARTMGDLADLLADLPQDRSGYELPVPVAGGGARPVQRRPGAPPAVPHWRAQVASYVTTSLICVLVWLVSGRGGGFWPIWVIGPWGIVLIGQAIRGGTGPQGPGRSRPDRPRRP